LEYREDLSTSCLVLTAEDALWREVMRPALTMASLSDGRALSPERVDSRDAWNVASERTLGMLEYGAVLVADLVDLEPALFELVAWHARARPGSTILLRRGDRPLPLELHEFHVRTWDPSGPERASQCRIALASLAAGGGERRQVEGPARVALTAPRENLALRLRREKSGVIDAVLLADRDMLDGNVEGATNAMREAVEKEPQASDLLLRLALLYRRASRWPEAIETLERSLRVDAHGVAAWRELGIARDRGGVPGAEDAFRRALEIEDDYEALVALGLLLTRESHDDEAGRLFEHAMEISGWQLNLVLPTLVLRAARLKRIAVAGEERVRVEQVLAIRRAQARATPPVDAPWSFFDAARAHVLLGDVEAARHIAEAAGEHLSAPWQVGTFARSLTAFEAAGVDVEGLRACLGIERKEESRGASAPATRGRPFEAAARDPAWYVENVPCMHACPVGTDAGAYVHLAALGRTEDAYRVARGPNPFASVCGRICAAPCEDACRRGHVDAAVEIRSIKRYLTERHGVEGAQPRLDRVLDGSQAPCIEGEAYVSRLVKLGAGTTTGRRVVVVGGGPAGLACAHDLAFLGHRVTLLESTKELGGMMRQGIPVYRLPRDLLDREIQAILDLGVEVRLATGLDAEHTLATLFEEGAEAVFLASGAGRGRYLEVEGAHLDGVVRAIDFLLNVNEGFQVDLGRRVVVIGGGNVAMDVARTARLGRTPDGGSRSELHDAAARLFGPSLPSPVLWGLLRGASRDVHVVARQPLGEWPAQRSVRGVEEVEEAMHEGVVFHPLRGVRRFVGDGGRLKAVELAEVVQLRDRQGRYRPAYGAHAAETIPCDTAFLAVGQEPDLDYLAGTADVHRTAGGLIEVDPASLETSMRGVWAGGDAAFGPRTLIEAVGDGKRAARNIHAFLAEGRTLPVTYSFEHVPPRGIPAAADYDRLRRVSPPSQPLERRTGIGEVEGCFDDAEARRQAERCLVCHVQTVYDGDLCIACGRCTDVCPFACLSFVRPDDVAAEGLYEDVLRGAGADAVVMVKDEDRCIRCGLCAERCPTHAMTMERFGTEVHLSGATT